MDPTRISLRERARQWARVVTRELGALALATRDPRVPWYAKALAAAIVAYALSPIDLIPDFIPVIGYLDDFVLVPLGILLVIRLIPRDVMADLRRRTADDRSGGRGGRAAAAVVVVSWIVMTAAIVWWIAA